MRAERIRHSRDLAFQRGKQRIGIGVGVFEHVACADMPGEIHRQDIEAAPSHLDPDGVSALGPQRDRHRRLPDTSAHACLLREQAVVDEPVHDHRHALHTEPRQSRHVGLRQRPMQAHRLQHDALVELPHADLVRADRSRCVRMRARVHG